MDFIYIFFHSKGLKYITTNTSLQLQVSTLENLVVNETYSTYLNIASTHRKATDLLFKIYNNDSKDSRANFPQEDTLRDNDGGQSQVQSRHTPAW